MHNCGIDEQLRNQGLYKTHPRHRILELFHENRPWCAHGLQRMLHDVGLATIYRTLRLLVKQRVISEVDGQANHAFYERTGQPHHDHLRCEHCESLECLPCPVPELKKKHTLHVSGTCHSCRA